VSDIDSLVGDALAIARIPAPTFDEAARIGWLEDRLVGAPGTRRRDETGNLLWQWGEGRPRLLITAHVDTVFARDVRLDVRELDGRLVGPGVGDNAVAVAMTLQVAESLLAECDLAPGAIAFTVCEEGPGNLRGAFAACQALEPHAMIALEGHGLDRVFVDAVGSVRASVVVSGPGGHSWVDNGRPSAVHTLFEIGLRFLEPAREGVTVNIGTVSGGRSVNAIADACEMVIEMRSTDELLLDGLAGELQALTVTPPLSVSVELIGRRPAGRLPRDADLLRVVRAVRSELGLPAIEDAASTDANAGLACGIPALALGAALGADMHTTKESIDTGSIALGRRQLELLMRRLLAPAASGLEVLASGD
jgi:acetylornithine deacetylase/succinyl-diaminopimelate desuccinylase-like protein